MATNSNETIGSTRKLTKAHHCNGMENKTLPILWVETCNGLTGSSARVLRPPAHRLGLAGHGDLKLQKLSKKRLWTWPQNCSSIQESPAVVAKIWVLRLLLASWRCPELVQGCSWRALRDSELLAFRYLRVWTLEIIVTWDLRLAIFAIAGSCSARGISGFAVPWKFA